MAGFGEGSSPALVDDTLIVNWDHEGDSFVVAIDARTGTDKWRKDRDEVTSWTTPVIAEVDGRKQAIISATGATRAYDVENGDVIWSCEGMTVNSIPTPIVRDGIAYLMSGFRGAMLQAVRLSGAKGNVTDTDHVLWRHERQTSYVPSALLLGEHVYFLRSTMGCGASSNVGDGKPLSRRKSIAVVFDELQAARVIQKWYRRHQASLELRRKCNWKMFTDIEYQSEAEQVLFFPNSPNFVCYCDLN